jgi:hypothetical protein
MHGMNNVTVTPPVERALGTLSICCSVVPEPVWTGDKDRTHTTDVHYVVFREVKCMS